jgi:2'-5' RNA ligase
LGIGHQFDMSETFRAFIAIDLPETVRLFLTEVQEALKSYGLSIKWIRPQNIHLTLKFLGDTEPALTAKIAAAMTSAAMNSGSQKYRGFSGPEAATGHMGWP